MSGPLQRYDAGVRSGEFQFDEAQHQALKLLQALFEELQAARQQQSTVKRGFFSVLLGRKKEAPKLVRGLYFWGGVGRGKTFLMDLFYEALPFKEKKRLHFHRFMREVHHQLRDLQGETNPLKLVAARFASQARILCFDEFFVSDITDAMLLAGLLDEMFRLGITLVATSNVEPADRKSVV